MDLIIKLTTQRKLDANLSCPAPNPTNLPTTSILSSHAFHNVLVQAVRISPPTSASSYRTANMPNRPSRRWEQHDAFSAPPTSALVSSAVHDLLSHAAASNSRNTILVNNLRNALSCEASAAAASRGHAGGARADRQHGISEQLDALLLSEQDNPGLQSCLYEPTLPDPHMKRGRASAPTSSKMKHAATDRLRQAPSSPQIDGSYQALNRDSSSFVLPAHVADKKCQPEQTEDECTTSSANLYADAVKFMERATAASSLKAEMLQQERVAALAAATAAWRQREGVDFLLHDVQAPDASPDNYTAEEPATQAGTGDGLNAKQRGKLKKHNEFVRAALVAERVGDYVFV